MTAAPVLERPQPRTRSDIDPEPNGVFERILVGVFTGVPFLALFAAIPLAWGWGLLSLTDVAIAVPFYLVSGLGVTVGYHRCFTHGSFKASRPLRIALAVAGSLAIEGPVITW